jgi:hypothetical protein
MSENISNELPVITNIEDIPESALEELTDGQETEKSVKKSSASKKSEPKKSTKKSEEVAKDE